MTTKPAVFAWVALLLACSISPAPAGQHRRGGFGHWRATHGAIYQLENRIAYLEADPEIDDDYKAPIIAAARAEIFRLRAALPPAHWRWVTPCCYGRRPIRIR